MKINVNNVKALNSAISDVEGRATARTIAASDVFSKVAEIEKQLKILLPKNSWRGLKFLVDPNAQRFPKSYKYTPKSTQVILERGSRNWFVVEIKRDRCNGPNRPIRSINLDERAEEIKNFIIKNF